MSDHTDFAFAGDWHGDTGWAQKALARLALVGVGTVYQVGDFGLWPGDRGFKYLRKVAASLSQHDQRLYVVLGNHDDHDKHAQMVEAEDGWLRLRSEAYERIRFAPRAHLWEAHGLRFASLVGAGSIDRGLRTPGRDWWAEEEISDSDCAALVEMARERGWLPGGRAEAGSGVDVFVSHEAPAGLRIRSWAQESRPAWFTVEVEHYCWAQRVRLRGAVDQLAPNWLVHGHWHLRYSQVLLGATPDGGAYECQVIGLANEGTSGNLWRPRVGQLLKPVGGESHVAP